MEVGHLSLAYYLCMDTVPKKVRCMEVIERERDRGNDGGKGVHHLSWMGGRGFFPQGQGANLFISLEVTMKFY